MLMQSVEIIDELAFITPQVKADCAVEGFAHCAESDFPDYLEANEPALRPLVTRFWAEYSLPENAPAPRERYRLRLAYCVGDEALMYTNNYTITLSPDGSAAPRMKLSNGEFAETLRLPVGVRRRVRKKPAARFDAKFLYDELTRLQHLSAATEGR
jgi:hypothetical protein